MANFDTARTAAVGANFGVYGVPATVTRPAPDNAPVTCTVINRVEQLQERRPFGGDFQKREGRRVMSFRKSEIATQLPRGTTVVAPERKGGADKTWVIDSVDRVDAYCWHMVVTLAVS
ncbi:MAG: hypothetical protein Q8L86_10095 [Vicinamibacterales bacterium]|nr:hypothetical protein [Vicinamibacterales bacterium]